MKLDNIRYYSIQPVTSKQHVAQNTENKLNEKTLGNAPLVFYSALFSEQCVEVQILLAAITEKPQTLCSLIRKSKMVVQQQLSSKK